MITELVKIEQVQRFVRYHLITIVVVIGIGLALLIHKRGTNVNRKIAQKYRDKLSPLLSSSFTYYEGELVEQSPNIIKIYPSGRHSCLFAIISFALIPRQQIISFFLNPVFFRLKDQIVVEIPVNTQHQLSITAAIVKRSNIKTITKKSFPDVKQLCKEYKPITKSDDGTQKLNVPSSHCLLVEKVEHVKYFLYSEKEANEWKKHGKSVKLVYISDVNKFSRYPMAVRMVMNMNQEDLLPMFEWLISFVDRMAKAKMSIGERKEALKKREGFDIKYD